MSDKPHAAPSLGSPTPGAPSGAVVVGVDYGTLSGRAVVVRVRDGAELGSAVFEYPHAVISDALPSNGAALPPDWALQVPSDYVDVLKNAVPQAIAAAVSTRSTWWASVPISPHARWCRPPPTGPRCASCPSSPTGRTRM